MDRRQFLALASASVGSLSGCSILGQESPTVEMRSVNVGTDTEDHYFDPIGLFLKAGTTVTFEVQSGIHTTTAYMSRAPSTSVRRIPENAEGWDSKRIDAVSADDPTFEHTFEVPGTYDYFCRNHKDAGMVGRILVEEAGGPAEGSMPPDGVVPESQRILETERVGYDEFTS